ncbi:TPA: hypothetical protein ACH3X1_003502 [Trebouxia sp. C0004]
MSGTSSCRSSLSTDRLHFRVCLRDQRAVVGGTQTLVTTVMSQVCQISQVGACLIGNSGDSDRSSMFHRLIMCQPGR